jgi:hypothetical protein
MWHYETLWKMIENQDEKYATEKTASLSRVVTANNPKCARLPFYRCYGYQYAYAKGPQRTKPKQDAFCISKARSSKMKVTNRIRNRGLNQVGTKKATTILRSCV